MPGEKKVFAPTYRIYRGTAKGGASLSRKWFVYWYEGSDRKKKYANINQFNTVQGRDRAAKQLIKQLKAEHRRKVTKVEQAVWRYIDANWNTWSKKTQQQYKSSANVFLDFLAGRELTQQLVDDFLLQVRITRHGTTYNRYLAYVKRFLHIAGYDFFTDDLKRVRAYPTPDRYFQSYQAKRLLATIDDRHEDLGRFVRFIYYCALRPRREVRLLKASNILLEDNKILVPGSTSKNNKPDFVVIPDSFRPALEYVYGLNPGDYLFPSPKDVSKPIGQNTMYNRHRAILKDMNFGPGYTIYSWKHTGAVAAAKSGISVKELQIHFRHHSLDQTDQYLRQLGIKDLSKLQQSFPAI